MGHGYAPAQARPVCGVRKDGPVSRLTPEQRVADWALCGAMQSVRLEEQCNALAVCPERLRAALDALDAADAEVARLRQWLECIALGWADFAGRLG